MDWKELRYFAPFVAAAFVFIFSIPPANFPLNDDIIYFESVRNFVDNGSLMNNQPYTVSLVLQILYGSLFASVFGLSHSTLMLSMMIMGGLVVIATYFLLRTKLDAKYSILGSLLLLTNPIFFNLTHTFMTDVFALLFIVISTTLFLKFSKNGNYTFFLAGVLIATAGFWVRQFSIMPIAGLFLYLLIKDRKTLLTPKIILPMILIPLASVAAWGYWFYVLRDQSYVCAYTLGYTYNLASNIAQLFIYAGYFLFPLGMAFLLGYKKVLAWLKGLGRFKMIIPIAVLLMMVAFPFVRSYVGSDINPFDKSLAEPRGVGAYTISGDKLAFFPEFLTYTISGDKLAFFPDPLWVPIIVLSFVTAFSLVTLYLRKLKENLLLILTMVSLAAPMLFFTAFYDRYYLFLIPLSLAVVLPALKDFKYAKHVLIFAIIAMGAWSWYGTYDYLAWNTARWDGINHLLAGGVAPEKIDGGLEYDARFFEKCTDRSAAVRWHGWAYSISDEYIISFSELDGYDTLEKIDYFGPFGEKMGSIFVEKKVS